MTSEERRASLRGPGRIETHKRGIWLLKNPAVTAPIIGPRTADQLKGSLRALEIELSDETMVRLDAIWPGPGGEAPKAYAW